MDHDNLNNMGVFVNHLHLYVEINTNSPLSVVYIVPFVHSTKREGDGKA